MKIDKINTFFEKNKGSKVLVVGDLMIDEYLWGDSERISPEAPVPVFKVCREEHRLGGAGNVAMNLVSLGCDVVFASVVGDDRDGQRAQRLFEQAGINASGVFASGQRCTTRKSRLIAQQQQMLRIDQEDITPLSADLEQRLLEFCGNTLADVKIVLLSDYMKGVLTAGFVTEMITSCKKAGVPVLIDPKGQNFNKYQGATLLTPNRKELATVAGSDLATEIALAEAAESLRDSLTLEALIVTRSEEGMSLYCRNAAPQHLTTEAREVYDISGAGDTVLATLGAAMATGLDLVDAAKLANYAAGIVVGKVGTSTVLPEELRKAVIEGSLERGRKIFNSQDLSDALTVDRAQGRCVVFTNGCFDLLHVGHVKYLEKARKQGDVLVLGLNSDASIRRLKGAKRPLIGQDERSHILAALDCVDYVVIFDEDTPLGLIEQIRPDVLVKGGDYLPDQVVGRDFVESYGGRLELIQFVDGKSTSNIINRVLESYQDE
jgi:D-beta-D-heptose 7-phosphate kinase/D-beta-D-heptose 1-phosphate adenosyltransferase